MIPRLLPNLTKILLTYEQDPTILASLTIKLLRPIKFTQALTLASEDALIQALRSPAPSAAILAITIIEKASRSPSDTAILSIMKGVVGSFIQTWLSTPHVEVGEKATRALGDLLEVDCDRRSSAGIHTKMNGLQLASGMPPGQGYYGDGYSKIVRYTAWSSRYAVARPQEQVKDSWMKDKSRWHKQDYYESFPD